jgi:hypothetical protein
MEESVSQWLGEDWWKRERESVRGEERREEYRQERDNTSY